LRLEGRGENQKCAVRVQNERGQITQDQYSDYDDKGRKR
jgi:hypothetical protein